MVHDIRFLYSFHIYYAKSFVKPKFLSWWCSLRGKTATTTKFLFTLYRIEFITACIAVVKRRYTEIIHHFIIFGFYDAGFGLMLTSTYTNAHNSSMFWKDENGGHVNFAERKYFIQYDVGYIKTSMRNPMWMYKRWNKSEYNLMMELHTYSLE